VLEKYSNEPKTALGFGF